MEAAAEAPSKRLPLREAVVKYQFPGRDDEPGLTVGELIQQFCKEALGFEADFRIEFDQEQHGFDVLELLDVWEDGRRGTRLRGIFWVGEDRLYPIVEQDENDALAERINAAIGRLYSLLQGSLKHTSNAGRLRIWARQETLCSALTEVPAPRFAKYEIKDWFNGNAEADGGPRLFDIHVDLALEEIARHSRNAEVKAIRTITAALRENSNLTRAEAKALLVKPDEQVSDIGFRQRVWPRAREDADLPSKAPSGRKRRNRLA